MTPALLTHRVRFLLLIVVFVSPLPLAHTERNSDYDSFSQEIQFTGSKDRLNYVLGAYYFTDDGTTLNPQFFFGGANRFDSRYGFETDAWAAFGQADFEVTDRLTITGSRVRNLVFLRQ